MAFAYVVIVGGLGNGSTAFEVARIEALQFAKMVTTSNRFKDFFSSTYHDKRHTLNLFCILFSYF